MVLSYSIPIGIGLAPIGGDVASCDPTIVAAVRNPASTDIIGEVDKTLHCNKITIGCVSLVEVLCVPQGFELERKNLRDNLQSIWES